MTKDKAKTLLDNLIGMVEDNQESDYDTALKMGIQALSQEPCTDTVSRQWLMRKATERFYTTNYFNHISAMIEEAPSVTQKPGKWISAEERLPEDIQQRVLVYGQRYFVPDHVEDVDHYSDYGLGQYSKEYECWFSDIQDIIAWMPLSKPYEPQESEDKE